LARQVLDLVADKWTVLVIYGLASGVRRPGQLRRTITGISQKMLTQTLRRLDRDGIVLRISYSGWLRKVEYTLTPLGETLVEPLVLLCHWAEAHLPEVAQARTSYDGQMLDE
jgi:DNA-binding HxlR family transcriptional regulator